MRYKFSQKERLEIFYIELERLENLLQSQLVSEIATHKHAMKPSKTTRYKISLTKRAISTMEKMINFKADNYLNWQNVKGDIQRELDYKQERKEELLHIINEIQAEITNANGLDFKTITASAMEFSTFSQELTSVKRDIEALEKELVKHLKKEPPHATVMNREQFLAEASGNPKFELPQGLYSLAKDAVERNTDVDFTKNQSLYPDVSFMFEGREKDESEIERSIREDSTVASDKDASDSE